MEVSNVILSTLVEYCSEVKATNACIDTNIPFDQLENKDKWEVLLSKHDQVISRVKVGYKTKPQITMEFIAALANLAYGVICHENEEFINKWNEEGLFRMFFRCLYCQDHQKQRRMILFSSVCRLLSQASFVSLEVFGTLVETQDCITALLQILVNLDPDIHNLKTNQYRDEMWKYAFELIGVLMSNKDGLIVVWRLLSEDDKILCFFQTLLFCLNSKNTDLRKAIYFCLSNLLNGFIAGSNICSDELIKFLNNTEVFASTASLDKKESSIQGKCGPKQICLITDVNNVEYNGEDLCETQCLAEDLCKCLIERCNIMNVTQNKFTGRSSNEYSDALCSCLSALFATSEKARFYAIHVGFTLHLLNSIHMIRNLLTVDGKSVEILKSTQRNPSLLVLDRLLILMINLMRDCSDAKDCLAENNICVSINKLWPWFMVTKSLRHNIIQFLDTFTNGCAKAWSAMHNCVALRCLLYEIIALLSKEMSTLTQSKQTFIIKGCLKILENCCAQIHCRTLILKSEVLNYVQKLHPAISKRRPVWKKIDKPWEQFLLEVTTYSEGQVKLMEHSAVLCALILQADGLMLRVLTNCAFCSVNRVKFTSSSEILHLFSVKLLMEGSLDDKISICGAIWALAANNHKAKLLLRNAGLTANLRDCITSLKSMSPMDDLANQACELMTYVQQILTIS